MKKNNLKSLKLSKKSISNLNSLEGGQDADNAAWTAGICLTSNGAFICLGLISQCNVCYTRDPFDTACIHN